MIDDFSSNYLKQLVKEHRKSKNINKKGSEPAEQVDFLFNVVNQVIIEILFVLDTFFHCIQVMLLPENQFIFGFQGTDQVLNFMSTGMLAEIYFTQFFLHLGNRWPRSRWLDRGDGSRLVAEVQ
jgi:hypothetical protein